MRHSAWPVAAALASLLSFVGCADNEEEPSLSDESAVSSNSAFEFEETGSVALNAEKAFRYSVPAGRYTINLSGSGNADLYVRKNAAATTRLNDCRSAQMTSKETCEITFDAPGELHVMVLGYQELGSSFRVKGGPSTSRTVFEETGSVALNEEKAFRYSVPAGRYTIDLSGKGGDNLYVRKNAAATTRLFDCQGLEEARFPYQPLSKETCEVTFDAPGELHVMVLGSQTVDGLFWVKGTKQ